MSNRHQHWGVTVDTHGEEIVRIETNMLTGREISEADEHAIRCAAYNLLGFIGEYPAMARNLGRPRIEDAANSFEATKPWLALGWSRSTWYRRQAEKRKEQAL
jgi:hypothetical protein